MQLSKRLRAVADLVPKGSRVADIGCDHAYVSLYLVKNHSVEYVIAMDVNRGPLQRAEENVKKYDCSQQIVLRLSDGAKALIPGEADVLLIAGMGGGLIRKILSESSEVVRQCSALVLQPQSEVSQVRKYVYEIGFAIREEKILVDDGKYYTMFRGEKRKTEDNNLSEMESRYGKLLLERKDNCLYEFLKKEEEKYQQIIRQLENSDKEKNREQYEKIIQDYRYCREGLSYYEM